MVRQRALKNLIIGAFRKTSSEGPHFSQATVHVGYINNNGKTFYYTFIVHLNAEAKEMMLAVHHFNTQISLYTEIFKPQESQSYIKHVTNVQEKGFVNSRVQCWEALEVIRERSTRPTRKAPYYLQ